MRGVGRLGDAEGRRSSASVRPGRLQLGTKGRHHGVAFVVRGRLTLRHSSGATWSEWYASFADGRGGWIAPWGTGALVTFEANLPSLSGLRVGKAAWPAYVVLEKGRARYESAEGVLPFAPPFGESYAYADLVAPDGAFATLDYSESPPRLFAGMATTLEALHLVPPTKTVRKRAPGRTRTR